MQFKRALLLLLVAVMAVSSVNGARLLRGIGKLGGGGLPAYGSTYVQPAYVQPAYVQPAYVQPAYVQPAYVQPAYVQPTYAYGTYAQPVYGKAYQSAVYAPTYAAGGLGGKGGLLGRK